MIARTIGLLAVTSTAVVALNALQQHFDNIKKLNDENDSLREMLADSYKETASLDADLLMRVREVTALKERIEHKQRAFEQRDKDAKRIQASLKSKLAIINSDHNADDEENDESEDDEDWPSNYIPSYVACVFIDHDEQMPSSSCAASAESNLVGANKGAVSQYTNSELATLTVEMHTALLSCNADKAAISRELLGGSSGRK